YVPIGIALINPLDPCGNQSLKLAVLTSFKPIMAKSDMPSVKIKTKYNCVLAAIAVPKMFNKAKSVTKTMAKIVVQIPPVNCGKYHDVIVPSAILIPPPPITQPAAKAKPDKKPHHLPINLSTQTDMPPALGIPIANSAKAIIRKN